MAAAVGGAERGLGRPAESGRCHGGRVNRMLLGFGRESAHQAQTPVAVSRPAHKSFCLQTTILKNVYSRSLQAVALNA